MKTTGTVRSFFHLFTLYFVGALAQQEHKVHNIVLYPDKESWCKTTPIKQVVTWPQCSSQELNNNVCVGACFSYMVPHSEPSAPGDLIHPYCDSCQPSESIWHTVTLECKDKDDQPTSFQKKVQIINNCSCSSCMKTSHILPDFSRFFQSLDSELGSQSGSSDSGQTSANRDSVNQENSEEIIQEIDTDASLNSSGDSPSSNTNYLQQILKHLGADNLAAIGNLPKLKELLKKPRFDDFVPKSENSEDNDDDFILRNHSLLKDYSQEKIQLPSLQDEQDRVAKELISRRGPHHSLVLDSTVKEKIDVESHYLQPAIPGQEISYHDNIQPKEPERKTFE